MSIARALLVAFLLLPTAALATDLPPGGEDAKKATICHWANGNVHAISISLNALDTHLVWHAEGGWNPNPGHEGDVFLHFGDEEEGDDARCQPTAPTAPPTTTTPTTAPGTKCVTPDGFPYVTSYDECPPPIVPDPPAAAPTTTTTPTPGTPDPSPAAPAPAISSPPVPVAELPRTGSTALGLALIGAGLAGIGGLMLLAFRRRSL